MHLLIVLPTHNEEKIIKDSLEKLKISLEAEAHGHTWQIVVADNASNDRTREMVRILHAADDRIVLHPLEKKGKGLAIKSAWSAFPADVSVFMDADLSVDLSALPRLVDGVSAGKDIVVGSRFLADSAVKREKKRKALSWLLNAGMRLLFCTRLSDTPCGFKAVNSRVVENILPKVKNETWFFDSELLLRAEKEGYELAEIPVVWSDERDLLRPSKVRCIRVGWEYLRELLRMKLDFVFRECKKEQKTEWKILLVVALVLIIFTNLPYLIGWLKAPEDQVFSGFILNGDMNTYFARIQQIKDGHWFLIDPFTHETQPRIWFDPFWLVVGLVSRLLSLSPQVTFHLFRILLTPVFVLVVYRFLKDFVGAPRVRYFALMLIFFASGVGAFLFPWLGHAPEVYGTYNTPIDLWVPEAFPYFSILVTPHFIAATMLLVFVFHKFFLAMHQKDRRALLLSILASAFLFLFHPFKIPVIYGMLFCYTALVSWITKEWRSCAQRLAIFILATLPSVLYIFWLMRANSVLAWHSAQNLNLTPPWYQLFAGFGLVLVFAIIGIAMRRRQEEKTPWHDLFLLTWLLFGFYIIYSPFDYQRRFIEGLFIPLAVFAAYALNIVVNRILKWKRFYLREIVFCLLFVGLTGSNVYITSFYLEQASSSRGGIDQLYRMTHLRRDYFDAMQWIKANTAQDSLIFSAPYTGNFLPGIAGRHIYIGHRPMTIFFNEKYEIMDRFFADTDTVGEQASFLRQIKADYLVVGPYEAYYGSYDPKSKDYLEEVYQQGKVAVYRVR